MRNHAFVRVAHADGAPDNAAHALREKLDAVATNAGGRMVFKP
jgi:hypothetical protein